MTHILRMRSSSFCFLLSLDAFLTCLHRFYRCRHIRFGKTMTPILCMHSSSYCFLLMHFLTCLHHLFQITKHLPAIPYTPKRSSKSSQDQKEPQQTQVSLINLYLQGSSLFPAGSLIRIINFIPYRMVVNARLIPYWMLFTGISLRIIFPS